MNLKNLLLIIFALLLVTLGNWLTEEGVKQVDKRLAPEGKVQKDYYLTDFSVTALNDQGLPQHRLQAQQLNHFTNGELTRLQQPELMIFKQNKIEWQVVAERGEISLQQDEVLLLGKVRLQQPSEHEPLQLTTSALHIQPERGSASTDQPVTLTQANTQITAIGMKIDQESQRLTLHSQVRGHYETLVP